MKSGKLLYASVYLFKNGRREFWLIHRLVMMAFRGPSALHVNHIDFNPLNNCLSNLEYVTIKENAEHSAKYGRYKGRNSNHIYCKLPYLVPHKNFTYEEISYIRQSPLSDRELAEKFNTPIKRIRHVR